MRAGSVYFVAVEPSADLLASETIMHMRKIAPDLQIGGIGGAHMAQAGVPETLDLSPLAIVGFFEALKAYGTAIELADAVVRQIIEFNPDRVVLVDSWGFMLRIAQRLRKQAGHIHIIKLVGPQIWATRPGRARTLAQTVDQLICIHEMEAPYYKPHNLPVTIMGNPALSRSVQGNPDKVKRLLGLAPSADLLLVLPGSRSGEIERVAPDLVQAAYSLKQRRPNVDILFAPAAAVRDVFHERFSDIGDWAHIADPDWMMADIMAGADYAMACSGTVTSELAVHGTPFLVAYRTGAISWLIGKYLLYRPRHITLLNIAADDSEIVPEYLQSELTAEALLEQALRYIDHPGLRKVQVKAQNAALARMQFGDRAAAALAAEAILSEPDQRAPIAT